MTNYYRRYLTVFHQGEELFHVYGASVIEDESECRAWEHKYTWETIDRFCDYPRFDAWIETRRKGRLLYINRKLFAKEWETPDLELTIKCDYSIRPVSLYDLIHYYDAEKAVRWLVERGINACHATELMEGLKE